MNSQEVLRCYQLLEDTDPPPSKLLAGFLVPSADPRNRRVALGLCRKLRERDDEVVVALLRLVRARNEVWAAELVCPAVETLLLLFGGADSAERVASLLQDTACVPRCERAASTMDVLYLAALYEHGLAPHLALELESVLSEALWSPELAPSALVLARAVCRSGGEDVPAAVELLFRALRHTDVRVACAARALLWETVSRGGLREEADTELLLSRLTGPAAAAGPASEAAQTVDAAGMVCVLLAHPERPRHALLLSLVARPRASSQQGRALFHVFVQRHLSVDCAGSALLFAICAGADPSVTLTALTGPRPLACSPDARRGLQLLYGIVARAEAVEELSAAILEHAAPDDRAFLAVPDIVRALETALGQ